MKKPSSSPATLLIDLMASTDDESGVQLAGQGEFTRLKNGEIGLDEYLDAAVISATSHLAEVLDKERLESMREVLRSQLRNHPGLSEWVTRLEALEISTHEKEMS